MIIKMIKGMTTIKNEVHSVGSGSFEVDEAMGKRFIALGVAEIASEKTMAPKDETPKGETPKDEDWLESLKIVELRKLAKEMDLDVTSNKKDDYVNAILEGIESAKKETDGTDQDGTEQAGNEDDEPTPEFNAEGNIQ